MQKSSQLSDRQELYDEVQHSLQLKGYADLTVRNYLDWVRRYVEFYGDRSPTLLGREDAEVFLASLASGSLSAATQHQAYAALTFFHRFLKRPLPKSVKDSLLVPSTSLPMALSDGEVQRLLLHLEGTNQLIAKLIYGSGLQLLECISLRVGDLDLKQRQIVVRNSRGELSHATVFPVSLVKQIEAQLVRASQVHDDDLSLGVRVDLPPSIKSKNPALASQWPWQFFFPAKSRVTGTDGRMQRHHVHANTIQRSLKRAGNLAGIEPVNCTMLRHSFAVHQLEKGVELRVVSERLGHGSLKTTKVYTKFLQVR